MPRKWPEGRISGDDDGETRIAISADVAHGVVLIAFEHPTPWIAMKPADARVLAAKIIEKSDELERKESP
jgi:hypothetical protein